MDMRSPKDTDHGLVGRALDQDDQGVGHGHEQDSGGEEQAAVERSQAKPCAPPAQSGAKGQLTEPAGRRHGQPATR
jgi:hypothetical protein